MSQPPGPKREWVVQLLLNRLEHFLNNPRDAKRAETLASANIEEAIKKNLVEVITDKDLSYRNGLLIQLAYKLCTPEIDTTQRHAGARTVAKQLGQYLEAHHIRTVRDAFENIGKNTTILDRGNKPAFDAVLRWAKTANPSEVSASLDYVASLIAATARPVEPMPVLDVTALAHAAVWAVFRELFLAASGGAYEQFVVACLLQAEIDQLELRPHVETKRINTSDAAAGVPGDVLVKSGTRIIDVYEVTAADWHDKVTGALRKIREHDLSRFHIVAPIKDYDAACCELAGVAGDVSLIDLMGFVLTKLAGLTRQFRKVALERLYQFLERYTPDVALVNAYVELLIQKGLAAPRQAN